MELIILDSSFRGMGSIDVFKSLLWTDRYWFCGDFELVVIPEENLWSKLSVASYFKLKESEHVMIPEFINIHSDIENGNELIIKGRSLESILDRRIVWDMTVLNGNLQTSISNLLENNIINPISTFRSINNFVFIPSTDPNITNLTIDTQFYGENLYKAISDICKSKNIGFKIILTPNGDFEFSLYAGVDRSYGQTSVPTVIFSPNFDNLINGDYLKTSQFLKTVALVAGEKGVGNTRITTTVYDSSGPSTSGLNRCELFVDASGVSTNVPGGELTRAEYLLLLQGKGYEELAKNIFLEGFDGEVDTTEYNYGDEYFMGDILQIEDEYGHSTESRVTELIHFQDTSAIKIYPSFTAI